MKVKFDALLVALGCPAVTTVDALHPCPKCHSSPSSMLISYSSRNTYFTCPRCGLSADAIQLAALCLRIPEDRAVGLFSPGGALHHTLSGGNAESTLTDYTKAANSQAIMYDLREAAIARISKCDNHYARTYLERHKISRCPPRDTGSLRGESLLTLTKSGLLVRVGSSAAIRARTEYIVHFTRCAGRLSGLIVRSTVADSTTIRLIIANGPETDSGGVYAASQDCPSAETLYVMSSPEEIGKLLSKRSVYTSKSMEAVAMTGFPLPPDYVRTRDLVFVTDGSDEFDAFVMSACDASQIACSGIRPALHVFDCRGDYETHTISRMLNEAVPLDAWLAGQLISQFASGGSEPVEARLAASPGLRSLAPTLATYIPAGVLELRDLLATCALDRNDFVDIRGTGRVYRTANSMLSAPANRHDVPGLVANFRMSVVKRVTRKDDHGASLPYLYQLRLVFNSGRDYLLYVPDKVLGTGRKFADYVSARIQAPDRPVVYTERKDYAPIQTVGAFDIDVPITEIPTSIGLRADWLELPRLRINTADGRIDRQIDSAPIAALTAFHGPSYDRYRKSYASARRLWAGKTPVESALAVCLSHAVFCALQDVVSARHRAFHVPSRLTVVNECAPVCKSLVQAYCHVVNGGASAYLSTSAKAGLDRYRSLPVLIAVPPGRAYNYEPENAAPAIVVANPAAAVQASALDRPVYLLPRAGVGIGIKASVLDHLQASFPYLLNEAIQRLSGISHRLLEAQRLPALYMYRLIARTFGFEMSAEVSELVSASYDSPGCGPVDLFFSALQQLCYVPGGVPVGEGSAVITLEDEYVTIRKSLYGRIAGYGRKRFNYAPSIEVLTSALEMSPYYYAAGSETGDTWSVSRQAWDARVACIQPDESGSAKLVLFKSA